LSPARRAHLLLVAELLAAWRELGCLVPDEELEAELAELAEPRLSLAE